MSFIEGIALVIWGIICALFGSFHCEDIFMVEGLICLDQYTTPKGYLFTSALRLWMDLGLIQQRNVDL